MRSICLTFLVYILTYLSSSKHRLVDSKNNALILGSSTRFNEFAEFVRNTQNNIILQLEKEDHNNKKFRKDDWEKRLSDNSITGYGLTAVLEKGEFIEKGAVSTTIVKGILSPERAKAISGRSNRNIDHTINKPYFAAALSLVLHSKSPMLPTFRSDIRYFELSDGQGWFGGGADLTPYYLFDEDAKEFHLKYKTICNKYSTNAYPIFKKSCDNYFFLPARGEHRGIGGIFFDDLCSFDSLSAELPIEFASTDLHMNNVMSFTKEVGLEFIPSYLPIVKRRKFLTYTEEQRHWQLLRRGRYIEFNLLYDRGVKFGLVPGGRVEAVLVSCPPLVAWDYESSPIPGSEEDRLNKILKSPLDWV